MRPLKLSLSGFTCFKEPMTVDFRDLELFAIIGQTGAGKSSILDGITYALFGETPRLGSKGLEALVSLGGSSMYAVLEFEASDGRSYRVSRVWSKKASEKALRFERLDGERVTTVAEGVKIKEVEAAIERVVGLDFAGFTRAILLPQGEFDRFLRGNATERRDLLKGLLGLERIEQMMRRAGEIARESKGRLDGLHSLLTDAAGVTPDAIETHHAELEQTVRDLETAQRQLQQQRLEVTEASGLLKLSGELSAARRDLEAWRGKAAEAETARERVAAARGVTAVMPVVTNLERAVKAQSTARVGVERLQSALSEVRARQAAALERQQRAVEAALETVDLDVRIASLNAAKPALERLRSIGGNLKDADPRFTWDEARFTRLEGLKNRLTLLRKLEKDSRDASQQLGLGKRELELLSARIADAETQLERLKSDGKAAGELEKTLEVDLTTARLENLVAQVVNGLEIGDPCPVCGAPLSAIPDVGVSGVAELEARLKASRDALQELRANYKAAQEALKNWRVNMEKTLLGVAQWEAKSFELEGELTTVRAEFAAAVGAAEDPISALQEARAGLVAGLAAEVSQLTGGAEIDAQLVALGKRKRALEDAQRAAERALSEVQSALGANLAGLEAAEGFLVDRSAEVAELSAELQSALRVAGCDSAEEAKSLALPDTELQRLERFEREYSERLNALKSRELELREDLGGRTMDAAAFAALEAAQHDLERQCQTLTGTQGRLEQVIRDLQARLRDKNRLTAEAATLEKRFDVYQALSNDLKGNQFQDYLLAQVQRDLLARASSVMRQITHDRYALALIEGEFCVSDAWNGMETRGVRTLSGGESFIASLSLALALSDYLAGSKALGALFLDEGFGTLDSEALDSVTGVLEALNTQGRTVGVITHVPSLAERLPNRLMVEKAQGSSRAYWTD